MRDYIAEANRFMYDDDNYIVESKSYIKKLEDSLKINHIKVLKYQDILNSHKLDPNSIKFRETQQKMNSAQQRVRDIQSELNRETAFNVEHHHTSDDIRKAYKEGHRGFKIKSDDPKRDDKYEAAHTALYLGNHGISTMHSKDRKYYTVFAH